MKILVFGATGSAGGSVLRVCLAAPDVEEVRAIVRRSRAKRSIGGSLTISRWRRPAR